MDEIQIKEQYNLQVENYRRTGENVKESLEVLLNEAEIPTLHITYRVKEFESFFKKVQKKKYSQPFIENEDFCGLRIILFLPEHLKQVDEIINNEFEVVSNIDKSQELENDQFGYRSMHYIAKVKPDWCNVPIYRGLSQIKFEIQVRTILMHAWAEVEHKLAYKNSKSVPPILTRKLSRLSAKFEEADEQFQQIFDEIIGIQKSTTTDLERKNVGHEELNLESLQGMLDFYLPKFEKHRKMLSDLYEDIQAKNLTFEQVRELVSLTEKHSQWIQDAVHGANSEYKTTQANLLKYIIDAKLTPSKDMGNEGRNKIHLNLVKIVDKDT